MDNRWKFLYCGMTELWGHVKESGSRMESPVQAGYQPLRQIRVAMGSRDAERNKVAKSVSHASRKAAIVLYRTRTVNRHRWMRENLRPAEEALSRNSAKMAP